jgi:hypothetical protein
MQTEAPKYLSCKPKSPRRCLACGDGLPTRRHVYCSPTCRQYVLASLNRRTGLLRALNTRYATFSFTEHLIVMDVLPYGIDRIFSYMLPRSYGRKPVEDFGVLCNLLGTTWWNERNRTHKRYMASRLVLEKAADPGMPVNNLIPRTLTRPSVRIDTLIQLELEIDDLNKANSETYIKQAFRRQAKIHHPDLGGNAQAFRKIHEAYERLIQWAKHPTFTHRCGFPGKWLYEGGTCRWVQPIRPTVMKKRS